MYIIELIYSELRVWNRGREEAAGRHLDGSEVVENNIMIQLNPAQLLICATL